MPTCVVKCCSRSTLRDKKEQGITFHRFPKENEWRKEWIQVIRECRNQMYWNPTKSSVVCSEHFQASDLYTTKGGLVRVMASAVPQNLVWTPQSDEQQNEQPAVPKTSFEESLESHAIPKEERPIELKELPTVSEIKIEIKVEVETDVAPEEADFEQPSSIQSTPEKMQLKEIISRKDLHISSLQQKIKISNQKIRKLKNSNSSLKNIVKTLRNKKFASTD